MDAMRPLNVSFRTRSPGFDLLLGMDVVEQLGGVQISHDGRQVRFLGRLPVAAVSADVRIDDNDFSAVFTGGVWTVKWRWLDGSPPKLVNRIHAYRVPERAQEEYEKEVDEWIRSGWLRP